MRAGCALCLSATALCWATLVPDERAEIILGFLWRKKPPETRKWPAAGFACCFLSASTLTNDPSNLE